MLRKAIFTGFVGLVLVAVGAGTAHAGWIFVNGQLRWGSFDWSIVYKAISGAPGDTGAKLFIESNVTLIEGFCGNNPEQGPNPNSSVYLVNEEINTTVDINEENTVKQRGRAKVSAEQSTSQLVLIDGLCPPGLHLTAVNPLEFTATFTVVGPDGTVESITEATCSRGPEGKPFQKGSDIMCDFEQVF